MTNFTIDIYSDTTCPWCYIGKRRLDRAISLYKKTYPSGSADTFAITWHAYYLDPTAPPVGVPLSQVFEKKFGPDRTATVQQRLLQMGRSEGIVFSFGGKTGRTRDSHRLIAMAGARGVQVQGGVVEGIFREYFEGDGDVTDREMLRRVAVEAGLDGDEVREMLEGDVWGREVDEEARRARERLGAGVPRFVVQGEWVVDGAEDPGAFLEIFGRVKEA